MTAVKTSAIWTTPRTARPGGRAVQERVGEDHEQLADQEDARRVASTPSSGPGVTGPRCFFCSSSLACLRSRRRTSAATISRSWPARPDEVEEASTAMTISGQGSAAEVDRSDDGREPDRPADQRRTRGSRRTRCAAPRASAPRRAAGCPCDVAATSGTRPVDVRAGRAGTRSATSGGSSPRVRAPSTAELRSSYSARSSRPSANASASTPWMTSRSASEARSGADRGVARVVRERAPHVSLPRSPILGTHSRRTLGGAGPWASDGSPTGEGHAGLVGPKREHVLVCDGRRSTGR